MRERQKQKCKKGMRYFEVCVTSRYAFDFSIKSRFPWTHSSGKMTMASHGRKSLPATQKTTPPSYQHRRRRRLGPPDCFLRLPFAFSILLGLTFSYLIFKLVSQSTPSILIGANGDPRLKKFPEIQYPRRFT